MPYQSIDKLPNNVQNVLPQHGQEIYLAAYNESWEEYKNPEDRDSDDSREEVAHKVAWAAVKNVYKKNKKGEWIKKE